MAGKLTAREAATKKAGRYGDGAGLYLIVSPSGTRKWVFRFTFDGCVSETGAGGSSTTLAEAREKAEALRRAVRNGINPVEARRNAKAADAARMTFGEMTEEYIRARSSSWRNGKSENQWRSSLTNYAQLLRSVPVEEVDTARVLAVLTPIWSSKPETANRVRNRIELILNAARAKGLRQGDNPAAWRGHLESLLPKRPKIERSHHAAMAYADVPSFIARLRTQETISSLALESVILTATRTNEVLNAEWTEFDLDKRLWVIPARRMKGGRVHRVPLCDRTLEILQKLNAIRTSNYVFFGQRPGKPLSHIACQKVLSRMNEKVTAHGFRSSFRDWAGDETHFERDVAEAALAHVVGDKAEQAYRRGDALEKRRALMTAWADHCEGVLTTNVVRFVRSSS